MLSILDSSVTAPRVDTQSVDFLDVVLRDLLNLVQDVLENLDFPFGFARLRQFRVFFGRCLDLFGFRRYTLFPLQLLQDNLKVYFELLPGTVPAVDVFDDLVFEVSLEQVREEVHGVGPVQSQRQIFEVGNSDVAPVSASETFQDRLHSALERRADRPFFKGMDQDDFCQGINM